MSEPESAPLVYRGLTLDAFQCTAIRALDAGRSALVCAPTGTGKTIIADWIVERALSTGKRVNYTAPIKALSNQKFRDYTKLYGEEAVGLVTGDLVIRRDAPCLVMTTEILRNMLLGDDEPEDLLAVILDEIHFLDDRERGTVWEEVLIYLPKQVQIVGLSATLSNRREFASWLCHVRESEVEVVECHERAVPLEHFYMCQETGMVSPSEYDRRWKRQRRGVHKRQRERRGGRDKRRNPRRRRKTGHLDIYRAMREQRLFPYLYFVFSRRDTEVCARGLGRQVRGSLLQGEDRQRLNQRLAQAELDLGESLEPGLAHLLSKGIAFHHAGLHVSLKALVEELYEAKLVRVLYCTSTFALGINMPARAVAFDSIRKYDGRQVAPLPTRGFMQKAGRAGRRGMDAEGHVVVRVDFEEYEEERPHLARYRQGKSEPVRSSFNLSWNSIVNLLEQHEAERIRTIVNKSFLAWHLSKQSEHHLRRADELADARTRKQQKEARRLRRRAESSNDRCWREFQGKVEYLKGIGYIAEDGSFNAGAKVLRHLQISEILVCELVLSGWLEDLEPDLLFGLLCCITNELPRQAKPAYRSSHEERRIAGIVRQIRYSDIVLGGEEMSGARYSFDADLVHLGACWARGTSLLDLIDVIRCETDLSGDLITGFRRAKDLIGQLRDVYADDDGRVTMLRTLAKTVSRDEVEVVG